MERAGIRIRLLFTAVVAAMLLGAPGSGISAAPSPVAVGAVLPTTGPFASGGITALHALTLAADSINVAGGVLGHPLQLLSEDSQGRPEIARAQHTRTYAFVGTSIRRLADRGVSEVSQSFYSPTSPVTDPIAISLRAKTPEVVVLGDPGRNSIEFVKRARELGLGSRFLSVGGALGDVRVARTLPPGDYLGISSRRLARAHP